MDNLEFLFAAYTIFWVMIFGYVFSISRRQKQLEREVRHLISEQTGEGQ